MKYEGRVVGALLMVLLAGFFENPVAAQADKPGNLYVTWEGTEPDKGASAWFIKRFVDPDAEFRTYPHGSPVGDGFAFDVPESRFRRGHRFSTYETLLHEYPVSDPVAVRLGTIIHDLEINTWGKAVAWETPFVEKAVIDIRSRYGEKPIPLTCYIAFFDLVYEKMRIVQQNTLILTIPGECGSAQ